LLSIGDKGDSVKEIKRNLALLGYLPGRDNDIFEAITRETLRQFQHEHGLLVTGVATFLTQAKIYYLVNKLTSTMVKGAVVASDRVKDASEI